MQGFARQFGDMMSSIQAMGHMSQLGQSLSSGGSAEVFPGAIAAPQTQPAQQPDRDGLEVANALVGVLQKADSTQDTRVADTVRKLASLAGLDKQGVETGVARSSFEEEPSFKSLRAEMTAMQKEMVAQKGDIAKIREGSLVPAASCRRLKAC